MSSPPTRSGHALIDPTQLEQVLMNLCVNARDAMPAAARSRRDPNVALDAATRSRNGTLGPAAIRRV